MVVEPVLTETSTVVSAEDVTRAYVTEAETVWAVSGVSLSAHTGQFVVIHGASGSGKSTLLRLLSGLEVPTAGRVQVNGHELGSLDEDRRALLRLRSIGVVFQHDNLIEEFTAAENVALPLEVDGTDRAVAAALAAAALSRVGLDGLGSRFPDQLSGGQRQRVGIARALAGERRLLVADEPTGALDSRNSRALFQLLRTLCDEGMTAVVSSHDPLCREYGDVVLEMVDGRLES